MARAAEHGARDGAGGARPGGPGPEVCVVCGGGGGMRNGVGGARAEGGPGLVHGDGHSQRGAPVHGLGLGERGRHRCVCAV